MYVLSVSEMRAAEAAASAAGITEDELQARAGAAVAGHAARLCPTGPFLVLVGIGNNGRDGWVAGRLLARAGRQVRLYLSPRHALTDAELASFRAAGGVIHQHAGPASFDVLRAWLSDSTGVLDGLLGIGARGAPRPPLDELISELNAARAAHPRLLVVAIDVPSGIDADSGATPGQAVRADATVTLGAVKEGLLRFPAAGLAGVLLGGDIGLPDEALKDKPVRTLAREEARALVPARAASGHKGSFGRVVVAAGSPHYFGAPYLAGAAAARSGCGLLAFAVAPRLQAVLAGLLPEATYVLLPEGAPDEGAVEAVDRVGAALGDAQALLLGPGIGRSEGARAFVRGVLAARAREHPGLPAVVDADALTILAAEPDLWDLLVPGAVLTPHHGEMARLIGRSAAEIAQDPWPVAREAAMRWQQTVVLKGPFTVVGHPDGTAQVLAHSNPALATGGTGDVLAGTIAGLLAQGLEPGAAARVAVYVHGAAAHAVCVAGERDLLLASDLLLPLSRELAMLRQERGDVRSVARVPWSEQL